VKPLLDSGRYVQALPVFEDYMAAHPSDRDVLKEYAITLDRAGSSAEAVLVFDKLLSDQNDAGIRLLLARGLRDRGRLDEASIQYGILMEEAPEDASLALEWGQALAWEQEYGRAAEVLAGGLALDSTSVDLRVALAQVFYWSGKLDDADRVLSELDDETLGAAGGIPLRREIVAALTLPEPETEESAVAAAPLTALEKIALAQAEEDYEQADLLYQEALRETPEDTSAWRAYADLLQFGLDDLEGARAALLPVEAMGGTDPALQFRMAQLDIWTGRNSAAAERLEGLLEKLEKEAAAPDLDEKTLSGSAEAAEVRALLGDLRRWDGDRGSSGESYRMALHADSANPRALAGLEELEAEVAGDIEDLESPGFGGNAYSLTDSDEFTRLDLGVGGVSINDHWVWGFRTGTRWLGGLDLTGRNEDEQGLFLELESARWWRWGTVRTGLHFGLEEVGPGGTELSFGASLRFSDLGGFRTDLRYDHGPAYPLTMTLQSVFGDVVLDRFTANLARGINERWSLSLAGDAAWLKPGAADDVRTDGSLRLEAGGSLGRAMTDDLVLGVNARALTYSEPSPVLDGIRLFWDPNALISGGVYAQWEKGLTERWNFKARLNPSFAFIDERTAKGFEVVPHFSTEAGLSYSGSRFRTTMDAFYYQGRFDRYRAYGVRLSVSARDWFRGGSDR
jgi:thioredoxin-like negative regulator of GroEL